jgi:chemotaxis methyl-accepting protein methylase
MKERLADAARNSQPMDNAQEVGMSNDLRELIHYLNLTYGQDLSRFDEAFLARAIDKRQSSLGIPTLAAYQAYLSSNSSEPGLFFDSLRICYSEFFRNPLTFALLEQLVIPGLVQANRNEGRTEIRVWSAGCASGQEAYSVAILLDEHLAGSRNMVSYRIFATDSSEAELASARQGMYDGDTVRNVRLKHIHQYFTPTADKYIVRNELKEKIDFSIYDLLDEHLGCPPASIYGDFDLVLCCNLLFYYRSDVRQRILDKVYRSLSPYGILVTGEAERETVAKNEGFKPILPSAAIFKKHAGLSL